MKSIYYVRHGECELNLLKVFAGHSDSPLTKLGREQATKASQDIIEKQLKIDTIVSSPLWRTLETARIIADNICYSSEQIITSELLIERCFGALEGTSREEFFNAYSYRDIDNVPRAETIKELYDRANRAFNYICSLSSDNILIVSHSGFYRALKNVASNSPLKHEFTSPFLSIKNGKVYEIYEC